MKRLVAALRRALERYLDWFSVAAEVVRFLGGRGEVAEVPPFHLDVDWDKPRRWQPCKFNADPHWCSDPMVYIPPTDREICEAMEWQFPKSRFRRIR